MTKSRLARPRVHWHLGLIALLPVLAWAQASGGSYVMRKQAIAGGGGTNSGLTYRLVGTVAETGAWVASGGGFRLTGGFHSPAARPDRLLCDGFEDTPCP